MFDEKQNRLLAQELDSNRIKTRTKGNISLSYLEGFDVIESANRIFGFGNWEYKINSLEQVSEEQNQNQNYIICYKAVMHIKVYDLRHAKYVEREDVGFGTGIAKTLADAHENAAKEAVTDGIKRALRSFGNQFGNSLYDKSRHHQTKSMQSQASKEMAKDDYSPLYKLGLTLIEEGGNLIVTGDNIFAKKESIKACGFKWDRTKRLWYKPLPQSKAA